MATDQRIRVLLTDDHLVVREGLRSTLRRFRFLRVVGMAGDGLEALRKVELLSPDVVLMDINMPGMNGLEATACIRKSFPKVKVLVVTVHESRQYVTSILRSGASGYVTKDVSPDELARAIKSVYSGESFLSPSITRIVVEDFIHPDENGKSVPKITERESEILRHLTAGKTNKEIASALSLSVRSIETFRFRLMRKLGVRNAAELTKFALEHQLVP